MKNKALGMLLFLPLAVWADYTLTMKATYVEEDDEHAEKSRITEVFKYRDEGHAKMQMIRDGKVIGETYAIGKKTYMVTYHGGKPQILDYDVMRANTKAAMEKYGMQEEEDTSSAPPKDATWKKTGKKVKVGELKGEEWIVSYTNNKGVQKRSRVTLSKERDVLKAVEAFGRFTMRMSPDDQPGAENMFVPRPGYALIKTDEGTDSDFSFTSLSDARISDSEFRLPKGEVRTAPDFSAYAPQQGRTDATDGAAGEQEEKTTTEDKAAAAQPAPEEDSGQETRNAINKGVDEAIDALKSLF